MRPLRRLASVLAVLSLGACLKDPTNPFVEDDAADAATTFNRLSDSVATSAGGDLRVAAAYAGVGRLLLGGGRITPVTVTLDGTTASWLAAGQAIDMEEVPCPPNAICAAYPPKLNTVVAWQASNPRRLVQVTTVSGVSSTTLVARPFLDTATVTYFDGAGGVYVRTGGTQSITVFPTGIFCPTVTLVNGSLATTPRCQLADFSATVNATVQPAATLFASPASGTHTIAFSSLSIAGSRLTFTRESCVTCFTLGYPGGVLPPLNIRPSTVLSSSLTATVDTIVNLSFKVTNTSASVATLKFNSSQQSDFVVRTTTSPAPLWRWSADRMFTGALTERTLQPGETATYTATWKPTVKGSLVATGMLTSSSHAAESSTLVIVP